MEKGILVLIEARNNLKNDKHLHRFDLYNESPERMTTQSTQRIE